MAIMFASKTMKRMRVRRSVRVVAKAKAAERTLWYPGATPPTYLDGSIPGDFGFDPLRLGETGPLGYYAEAELMNGRWAMAAVLGCVVTEAAGLPVWFEAGAAEYSIDLKTLGIVQLAGCTSSPAASIGCSRRRGSARTADRRRRRWG